jgi:hypothetical protein
MRCASIACVNLASHRGNSQGFWDQPRTSKARGTLAGQHAGPEMATIEELLRTLA